MLKNCARTTKLFARKKKKHQKTGKTCCESWPERDGQYNCDIVVVVDAFLGDQPRLVGCKLAWALLAVSVVWKIFG